MRNPPVSCAGVAPQPLPKSRGLWRQGRALSSASKGEGFQVANALAAAAGFDRDSWLNRGNALAGAA